MNIIRGQHHYDNHVVDYYYKLRKQPHEKAHKTAVIACINRLLKTIHYLVMNQKLYDYQMSHISQPYNQIQCNTLFKKIKLNGLI